MSSQKNPKKKYRRADSAKLASIIEAAINRFLEGGFAATSIEQIASDAGVSKVTIYKHFKDKRQLFAVAIEAECERMRSIISIQFDPLSNLRRRLTSIGVAITGFLSRPQMVQFERRVAAETEYEPALGVIFLEAGPHKIKAALARLLTQIDADGELLIGNAELAAEQFISLCMGMGDVERRFGMVRNESIDLKRVDSAVDLFCRAYAIPSPTGPTGEG